MRTKNETRSAGWRTSPFEIDGRRGTGVGGGSSGVDSQGIGSSRNGWSDGVAGQHTVGVKHGAQGDGAAGATSPTFPTGSSVSLAGQGLGGQTGAGGQHLAGKGDGKPASAASAGVAQVRVLGVSTGNAAGAAMRTLTFEGGLRQAQVRPSSGEAPMARGEHTPMEAQIRSVRSQALRGVAAALTQADNSVSLKLEPATLGQMRVNLQMNEGQMTASFEVNSTEARRLLERSMGDLRQALEARGVQVEKIEVQLLPPPASHGPGGGTDGANADGSRAQSGGSSDGSFVGPDGHGGGAWNSSEEQRSGGTDAERSVRDGMTEVGAGAVLDEGAAQTLLLAAGIDEIA